jgi:PPOX class probable F420-dependent enzyme
MTPAALGDPLVQAFLATREIAVLATLDPGGAPVPVPVWFVHDPSAVYVPTVAATPKVRHVARDPRVGLTAEAGRGADLRGLTLAGRADVLPDGDERRRVAEQLLVKYHPHLERRWGGRAVPATRVILRIVPDRLRSWGLA